MYTLPIYLLLQALCLLNIKLTDAGLTASNPWKVEVPVRELPPNHRFITSGTLDQSEFEELKLHESNKPCNSRFWDHIPELPHILDSPVQVIWEKIRAVVGVLKVRIHGWLSRIRSPSSVPKELFSQRRIRRYNARSSLDVV
ncbi:hypothetical protein CROQUDRAFT_658411 [Cronartium quercuum f. sp. fusiforme G11]|uniref:Uncharacterized protein n=1 Tax=Cronartium quercuum f. sp. fusiforme G11 TaxID=708437 RepID=A0A9P6TBE4_9BASI|nr:hypothetical protein CROQUDRAFT_658411 [Cronartium quercuum f. sp. fusiforme G11]